MYTTSRANVDFRFTAANWQLVALGCKETAACFNSLSVVNWMQLTQTFGDQYQYYLKEESLPFLYAKLHVILRCSF